VQILQQRFLKPNELNHLILFGNEARDAFTGILLGQKVLLSKKERKEAKL
jgi:hypothetical protein